MTPDRGAEIVAVQYNDCGRFKTVCRDRMFDYAGDHVLVREVLAARGLHLDPWPTDPQPGDVFLPTRIPRPEFTERWQWMSRVDYTQWSSEAEARADFTPRHLVLVHLWLDDDGRVRGEEVTP